MKNIIYTLLFIAAIVIPITPLKADTLSNRLKGRILLQVESNGEAWYVNPPTAERYYMANGNEAYNVMHDLGVGITNKDLEKVKTNKTFAKKNSGKIFLQIEAKGEAYYIDFNGVAHYLKDGAAAYEIMRSLGLGITNKDLFKILVNQKQEEENIQNIKISTSSPDIVPKLAQWSDNINICTSWEYSDWSICYPNGQQTRGFISQFPLKCSDGNPKLTQSCMYNPRVCTSLVLSDWGNCLSDGYQSRGVTHAFPPDCDDGSPLLRRHCDIPTCTLSVEKIGSIAKASWTSTNVSTGKIISSENGNYINLDPIYSGSLSSSRLALKSGGTTKFTAIFSGVNGTIQCEDSVTTDN